MKNKLKDLIEALPTFVLYTTIALGVLLVQAMLIYLIKQIFIAILN
jgi:hypothetical protein